MCDDDSARAHASGEPTDDYRRGRRNQVVWGESRRLLAVRWPRGRRTSFACPWEAVHGGVHPVELLHPRQPGVRPWPR